MKRAIKTIVFAHVEHYFGEFHTVGNSGQTDAV